MSEQSNVGGEVAHSRGGALVREGWVEVACQVADVIRHSEHTTPYGGRSDLTGMYGEPSVYTEWGLAKSATEVPVMREYRWPSSTPGEPDRWPCEHWVPTTAPAASGAGA